MTENEKQRNRGPNLVVDITSYRNEKWEIEDGSGQKEIDFSPGILRFIDALVLDMVMQEWKGKEPIS